MPGFRGPNNTQNTNRISHTLKKAIKVQYLLFKNY
jgi:hypothetical protein